ncbi:dephospho-CoA kinase [Alkalihalobacillus sp. NPDC078783]
MIIGLTGGIATGKSTVASMMVQEGIPVVDADVIARKVLEIDGAAYHQVVQAFGHEILNKDGSINRAMLGERIFTNESMRLKLNAIVHPVVRSELVAKAEAYQREGHEHVVMDIPLLYESELFYLVDKVLLVYVTPELQLKRLMSRDQAGMEQARSRINAQIPIDEKIERADGVIHNHGTREETRNELRHILKAWNG